MSQFDYDKLRRAIAERKGRKTFDEMEVETGVSRKAVFQFLDGTTKKLLPETIVKYCRWLGQPIEAFQHDGPRREATTLDKIERALLDDPTLTTEDAHALSDLMRAAYAKYAEVPK
jgi:hypothetical protein